MKIAGLVPHGMFHCALHNLNCEHCLIVLSYRETSMSVSSHSSAVAVGIE